MKNDISGGVRRLIGKVTRSRIAKKFSGLWFKCVPSFAIKRSAFGVACYFDSRDTVAYWLMTRSALESERISSIMGSGSGLAWDVGCNIGIYSLLMASRGRPVVAFDLSAKAVKLLNKSAKANGFRNIIGVARALSVAPIKYADQPT